MFDKLIDVLLTFGEKLVPCTVINEYEKGVLLRMGKFKDVLEPGFHWKIPFADNVMNQTVVPTTMNLGSQSLTTLDDINVVVSGVVKYEVSDVKVLLLEVYDAMDAIADMTQAIIKELVMQRKWEDLQGVEIDKAITQKARTEAGKWGLKVIKVTLIDVGKIRSLRMFNSTSLS
jgi:regulator of protease activity HflC (stomatin/prohibitin superfamily)